MGEALYLSLKRHIWYLSPQLVVFMLADKRIESKEKQEFLEVLLDLDRPQVGDFSLEQPTLATEVTPFSKLKRFISDQSYLLLHQLNISQEEITLWVNLGIDELEAGSKHSNSWNYFQKCILQTGVVNDRAERHIRLIQDFIKRTHNEEGLQNTLQVVKRNREIISKDATKSELKH